MLKVPIAAAALAGGLGRSTPVDAAGVDEGVVLPLEIQVKLVSLAARYDRNFRKRAPNKARVLIVRTTEPTSVRCAGQMAKILGQFSNLGGVPQETEVTDFVTVAALMDECRRQAPAIIYLTPGLGLHVPAIAQKLAGVSVITVASVSSYVRKGAVLGFDLGGARPRLLVNLAHARKQLVDFDPSVLPMMEVVE